MCVAFVKHIFAKCEWTDKRGLKNPQIFIIFWDSLLIVKKEITIFEENVCTLVNTYY